MKVAYKGGAGKEILRHLSFDFGHQEPIVIDEYIDLLKQTDKLVFLMDTANAREHYPESKNIEAYTFDLKSIVVVGENSTDIPLDEQIKSIPADKRDIVYIPLLTNRVLHAEAALAITLHRIQCQP